VKKYATIDLGVRSKWDKTWSYSILGQGDVIGQGERFVRRWKGEVPRRLEGEAYDEIEGEV
jgi:hypothetical protein